METNEQQTTEAQGEQARGDYSLAELRSMMAGNQPAVSEQQQQTETTNTPESGTEESGTEESGVERGEDGKFKPSPNVQKRIDKAVKAQREAERRLAELEAKLAANQGSRPGEGSSPANNAQPNQPTQQATQAIAKPDPAKFETYEAYIEALAEWKVEVREAARAKQEAERAQNEVRRKIGEAHSERVTAARERYADWDEVIQKANGIPIAPEVHTTIVESPHGPDIAYYLATHPEEMQRIAALSPVRQVAELGKVEARFDKPAAQPAQRKPLPKPPANVGGAGAPKQADLNDPEMDFGTFKRLASAQLRR